MMELEDQKHEKTLEFCILSLFVNMKSSRLFIYLSIYLFNRTNIQEELKSEAGKLHSHVCVLSSQPLMLLIGSANCTYGKARRDKGAEYSERKWLLDEAPWNPELPLH